MAHRVGRSIRRKRRTPAAVDNSAPASRPQSSTYQARFGVQTNGASSFIGPTDLSISLGVQPPPKWREAPLATEIARVLATARAAGKMAGIYCTTPEMAADMRRAGFDMIVLANDAVMLNAAAQQWITTARG